MAVDVGILTAAGGGLISFVSPCVLPLVPPYLCYMAGVSVDEFRQGGATAARRPLMTAAILFVLGFTTVFVLLGATASTAGLYLKQYQNELAVIAGVIIIIFGLTFLGLFKIPFLLREARFEVSANPASPGAAYLMGLAFAFGWTPCNTPILAPIISIAGQRASVYEGMGLLAVYSFALGVPFILAAMFSGQFMRFMSRFRVHMGMVEKVAGVFLIAAGVMFLTGGMQTMSNWLIETFPILVEFG